MSRAKNPYITEVKHEASGASCSIHSLGATLLNYTNSKGQELLFVSRDAQLDGSKAIRGGIPLVFPIFGPPPKDTKPNNTMPQHGFARTNHWTLIGDIHQTDESATIAYQLELSNVIESRGTNNPWETNDKYNVRLELHVTITGKTLETKLSIYNTGREDFAFQALFHTYYAVSNHDALNPQQCYVQGLQGYKVYNQVDRTESVVGSDPVIVTGELDSIHTPPDRSDGTVNVTIGVGSDRTVLLACRGTVDGQATPVSVVVWNPHQIKAEAMADFGNDQYHDMLCVEPGILNRPLLPSEKVAELIQVIRM